MRAAPRPARPIRSFVLVSLLIAGLGGGCGGRRVEPIVVETPPPTWERLVSDANAALTAQNYAEALRKFEQSLAVQPDNASVLFKLGELHDALGQRDRARERFAEGLRLSDSVSARNYLAYLDIEDGNFRAALVHVNEALSLDPGNLYAKALSGICALELGEAQRAAEILESVRATDRDGAYAATTHYDYYLGQAYRNLNDPAEAIEAYQRAETLSPTDATPLLRLGEVYESYRDWDAARDAYERAYARAPNDKGLRDKIAAMTANANAPDDAPTDTGEPVPAVSILPDDISDRIVASPNADDMPNADAVILLNRSEHEILPDGRSRFSTHQVVKILNRRAIADYGEAAIPFNSTSQNISVNIARTILGDGSVVEVSEEAFHDVTPPESLTYNLYSDTVWKVISFPALEEGVVVEYQVTVEDAYGRGNTDNVWFWGSMSFQNKFPTMTSQYALRIPESVEFTSKSYSCDVQPTRATDPALLKEGASTYLWECDETPAYVVETNGPPLESFVPRMAFSSVKTWDALHDWYRDLIAERAVVDDAISARVGSTIANAKTAEERARALAYFVAQECRYVAIQLGKGAFQPHSAADVLRNRYGDCKDKVTLLLAMLRVIGVEGYPALIQPAPEVDVDQELPSLAQFSHMILAIPNADGTFDWFDPSNTFVPFGELSSRNQGRTALLITPTGVAWTTTPTSSVDDNRYDWQVELEPLSDGGVKGRERLAATGTHASDIRAAYQDLPDRALNDALTKALAATYPGVDVEGYELSPMLDMGAPVTIDVRFSAESYGSEVGRFRFLPIPDADLDAYATFGGSRQREQPIDLNVPNRLHQRVAFRMPEGYRVSDVPRPVALDAPFASFRREYRVDAASVEYVLTLEIRARQVGANDYATVERLFELLAAESKAMLALEKIPPTPPVVSDAPLSESHRIEPLVEATAPEKVASPPPIVTTPTIPIIAPPPERTVVAFEPANPAPALSAASANDGDIRAVREQIETWRQTWENKDVAGYLARYADDAAIRRYRVAKTTGFTGFDWDVFDRPKFEAHIAYLVARYRRIRVGVTELRIAPSASDATEIVAEFTQRFDGWAADSPADSEQPTYADTGHKIVRFRRFGGVWRIAFESWMPVSGASDGAIAMLKESAPGSIKAGFRPATEWIRAAWLKRVETWRVAWVARRNAGYLALYAPNAKIMRSIYNDVGQLLWREMATDAFGRYLATVQQRYARYEVEVVNPQVFQDAAKPTVVEVQFEQVFRGWKDAASADPSYIDRGSKTLRYRAVGDRWLIVEETWAPLLDENTPAGGAK